MRCTETSTPPSEFCDSRFPFDLQLFADDGGEKTEEPTAKKKSDARNKGQVAKSQELNAAFVLFIGFWAMKILGSSIYREIAEYTAYIFGHLNTTVDTETVLRIFLGIVMIRVPDHGGDHADRARDQSRAGRLEFHDGAFGLRP